MKMLMFLILAMMKSVSQHNFVSGSCKQEAPLARWLKPCLGVIRSMLLSSLIDPSGLVVTNVVIKSSLKKLRDVGVKHVELGRENSYVIIG